MLPTVAAVGVLGVGGVSAAAVFTGGSSGTDANPPVARPQAVSSSVVHLPSSTAAPVPVTPTSAAPSPAVHRAVAVNPHLLSLTTVGRVSWIKVVGPHGHVLFMGMLRHGKTLRYTARPLSITLGDAGAVRVQHGATIYAHAGRNGQVKTFHVTS